MPNEPNYNLLAEAALEFFKLNHLGWIEAHPPNKGGTQKGWILGTCEGTLEHIVASNCHLAGEVAGHTQMRLWSATPENPEHIAGICAFLLFGNYEAIFTEGGRPIFLEGVEKTKPVFQEHYASLPTFKGVNDASMIGDRKIQEIIEKQRRNGGQGEEWKNG